MSPLDTLLHHSFEISAIPISFCFQTWLFSPDSIPQNPVFVREGLLQRDLCIVHGDALGRRHGSIKTQSLLDDAFEIGECLELLHGRRIACASAQFRSKLGLDCGVAGERK